MEEEEEEEVVMVAEEEGGEGFESPVAFPFSDLATPIITPLLTLGSFFVLSGQTFPGKRGYLSDSMTANVVGFNLLSGRYTVRPTVERARDRAGVEENAFSLACVSALSYLARKGKRLGLVGKLWVIISELYLGPNSPSPVLSLQLNWG